MVRTHLPRIACFIALAQAGCSDDPTGPTREPLAELPEDLAMVSFTASGTPTAPYALLEIRASSGFRGFVAIDAEGSPAWFFRTLGSPSGSAIRRNRNFVLLDNERGLVEVTPAGDVVRELPQEDRPGRFVHHDVAVTARNSVLVIAEDARPWPDTLVTGDAIWEWYPETGVSVRRWSSFDELVPELDRGPRSQSNDWIHANSLSIGASGDILVSSPFLNQVLGIAPDFGRLRWRLGGVRATLPVDDPFSGQHTVAEVTAGRVLMFDNGYERDTERYSRAVEYELSESSAHKVWEWRPPRDNWARLISSARRLPNGNTLVGFGLVASVDRGTTGPVEVYEVTPGGDVTWHVEVGGAIQSMYRATPLFDF